MYDASTWATLSGGPVATMTPASVATVWPQVDDIVSGFDDIKIVLDDEHGVASIHQAGQDLEQALDIREVQTCRRLIQHVQGASRAAPARVHG